MIEYIMVFRSRTQTMRFHSELERRGIPSAVINTPQAAKLGCGLSVRIKQGFLQAARGLLAMGGFGTFAGVFVWDGRTVRPL